MIDTRFIPAYTVVDGTETRVTRGYPKPPTGFGPAPESNEYSVKKKQHSACWPLIVPADGKGLLWAGDPTFNHSDQAAFNKGARYLYENDPSLGVLMDGGYWPNPKEIVDSHRERTIIGFKPSRRNPKKKGMKEKDRPPLTHQQVAENKALSQSRVVVENIFSRCKHWAILRFLPVKGTDVYKLAFLKALLDFLLPLVHRSLVASPPRKVNWKHPNNTQ